MFFFSFKIIIAPKSLTTRFNFKAERHLPDRCLRQFDMHQTIPKDIERWERKSRIVDHGVDLRGKMDTALKEWSERWFRIVENGNLLNESEYMQWYQKITRKYIRRVTSSVESEYQRTVRFFLFMVAYLSLEYML
jgi:hypothetical protein